jgi:hypothetical protein
MDTSPRHVTGRWLRLPRPARVWLLAAAFTLIPLGGIALIVVALIREILERRRARGAVRPSLPAMRHQVMVRQLAERHG